MRLPYVTPSNARRKQQTMRFAGVNYGDGVADGELENSRNVTSERFPCLSPRAGRTVEGNYASATAVYYKNGQFVVNGTELLYNGEVIANVTAGKKQFATVNTKVVVLPDKIMFDTATGEVRKLGAEYLADAGFAEILDDKTMVFHQGRYYTQVSFTGNVGGNSEHGDERPTLRYWDRFVTYTSAKLNSETGALTLDGNKEVFLADKNNNSMNIRVGTIFTKMRLWQTDEVLIDLDPTSQYAVITDIYSYHLGIGASVEETHWGIDYEIRDVKGSTAEAFPGFEALGFREGDAVEIEGMETFPDENGSYIIRELGNKKVGDVELPAMIFDSEAFAETGAEAGAVSIRRKVPNLTVVCESSNRLWGADGSTIFASALGDPTNFYTYDGLDTDSYAVAVASEGAFTGCCGFGNSVLFWKEDKLHKILGAYPSQYTMYEYNVPGVKLGSENSLVNVNEVIYYHGREGVYRYSGGSPELISENFGLRRFQEAAAGAEGDRYYISMQDVTSKEWGLWVYDILRGIWMQEDDSQGVDFAYNEGKLYFISGDGGLVCVNPNQSDETVSWSATMCRMDEVVHERKYYPKLNVRLDLPAGSTFVVEVSQDDGAFQQIGTFEGTTGKTVILPILLPRCDNFRIRMSGSGPVLIRSIVREYEVGSELF